jgi:hypothetical protein
LVKGHSTQTAQIFQVRTSADANIIQCSISEIDTGVPIVMSDYLQFGYTPSYLKILNTDDSALYFQARDNGVGLVNVGVLASAADPYAAWGASDQFKVTYAGKIFATLASYANNAAAVAAGLTAGQLYRTNADPDTVCVVH